MRIVKPEKYEERMAICKQCDHFFKQTRTCKKCGCFLVLKARIAPQKCPIDKWGKVELG